MRRRKSFEHVMNTFASYAFSASKSGPGVLGGLYF